MNKRQVTQISFLIALCLIGQFISTVSAESLFRASANYRDNLPYTPRSLYTSPTPNAVGDILTIVVSETAKLENDAELKVTRSHTIAENGSGLFNNMLNFMANKIPFLSPANATKVSDKLAVPSFDGMNNANNISSKAESTREYTLTDKVTCQVVQVLPNGMLMVQGRKTIDVNRDRQDLYVSGIVNPYYLNKNNEVNSNQVGNFQLVNAGKGVISRQQSDSFANKIYQYFN